MVPAVKGVGRLAARLPAIARGAMMGTKREISITRPQAMSQCGEYGAGGDGLSSGFSNPHVSPSPSKPEPLLAEADVNSYRTSEKPCAAGLFIDFVPQSQAAKMPVGIRIMSGWISIAMEASFISRASTFFPWYSGV